MAQEKQISEILKFWFEEHGQNDWYSQNNDFDASIRDQYLGLHQQAAAGELSRWRDTPEGRLAEIIILDQFSRNLFRGSAAAFANDNMALKLAKQAIENKADQALSKEKRSFLYLPFMHSESLEDHDIAMRLYEALGDEENLKFERLHKEVIERFGRYPHRNEALGRDSTESEKEFLADPNAPFKG